MSHIEVAAWSRPEATRSGTPLVIALHGRGSDESSMIQLADDLPNDMTLVAPRGPVPLEEGHTWFVNEGIGRPVESSIKETAQAILDWLDELPVQHSQIFLLGFSGGTAMAGALLMTDPSRFSGAVLLSGTLPWEVNLDARDGRLANMPVLWSIDPADEVIPTELAQRSLVWLTERSGAQVTVTEHPGGHAIYPTQVEEVMTFLSGLPAS